MFERGLVAETADLLKRGLGENRTAMQALGYRQVVEHLRGARPLPETVELVKIRTRQFAKRQMTWFKRQLRPEWIEWNPEDSPASVAALMKARMEIPDERSHRHVHREPPAICGKPVSARTARSGCRLR